MSFFPPCCYVVKCYYMARRIGRSSSTAELQQQRYGLYAQDLLDLNEHWKLLAGVRGDIVHQTFGNSLSSPFGGFDIGFPFTESDQTFYRMTPRVGLVYQPIPEALSIYGAYSHRCPCFRRTFGTQPRREDTSHQLAPAPRARAPGIRGIENARKCYRKAVLDSRRRSTGRRRE